MQNNILNVLKKEIREMFRDKKSLAMMLIIPILIPFIVLGMSALFEMQVNLDISEYNKIGFNYTLSETEQEIINTLEIDPTIATEEELKEKYNNEEINLYILKNDNNYTIYGNDNEITTLSSILAESYLNQYKEYLQGKYLETSQVDPNDVLNIITIQKEISEVIIPNKIPVYSENINPPENERAAAGSCYQRRTGGRPVRRNPGAGGHQCHRRPDPG